MHTDDAPLYNLLENMDIETGLVRSVLELAARQLVRHFITERSRLQRIEMDSLDRSVGYQGKRNRTYAPLCISVRVYKKSLEITWFLTHHSRRNVNAPHMRPLSHHKNLPASKVRGSLVYTSRTLKKFTRHWEEELVLATEARAAELRALNAHTTKLRRSLTLLMRRVDATAPAGTTGEPTEKTHGTFPEVSIYDNPNVAPQPPQHRLEKQ